MILEAAKTKKQNPMELLVEKSSHDKTIIGKLQYGRPLDLGLPNFHTYPGSKSIFAETTAGTMSSGTVDPETLLSMLGRWIECD